MPNSCPETESRIKGAILFAGDVDDLKVSELARDFGLSGQLLRARLLGRPTRKRRPKRKGSGGQTTRLSALEEEHLCNYINRLQDLNFGVRREFIRNAANEILAANSTSTASPTVGVNYVARFTRRKMYHCEYQEVLDAERHASENIDDLNNYFLKLKAVIQEYGIVHNDIWNMDETGYQIVTAKNQMVMTRRRRQRYFGSPENRESATAVEAISAGGLVIPAFLVLSGIIDQNRWDNIKHLDDDTLICVPSSTGHSNGRITMDWIRHFQKHTKATTEGGWRLLLMDGNGSHHTKSFLQYCCDHKIVPFGYLPHSSHLLQPLDMVVFQSMEHYRPEKPDHLVREGCTDITKIEFLAMIQEIRQQVFNQSTILSAFRQTGVAPFNPTVVLERVRARVATPSPPPVCAATASPPSPLSSPLRPGTPTSHHQLAKLYEKIMGRIAKTEGLDPKFVETFQRFAKGALIQSAKLELVRAELQRTRAELQRILRDD